MPIYRGTTPLKAYKGDMQPVNVYRGSTKVAGWHSESYSGTSPLVIDCDYNVPPDALVVDGKCVQTGTPSPDSPAPISTITGDMTITGADGTASDTVTVALGSNVCASLPDGTHDSYDAVTGVLTKRVGKVVFDGSADDELGGSNVTSSQVGIYYRICTTFLVPCANISWQTIYNDRFPYSASTFNNQAESWGTEGSPTRLYFKILVSRIGADTFSAFKSWLAANPMTVYYKLATPTTVQLTPHLPVVRTGIKTLTVGADVAPNLSATVKSMD